jgi:PPOX class probable F420-dependent enzyme
MPALEPNEARRRFAAAPVARLATITPDGRPHIVPITFALEGDRVYSVVDTAKPKSRLTLVRLRNIDANSRVSLLVDEYGEDWERLWWVRADGTAHVAADGAEREHVIGLLQARYTQYRAVGATFGAAIVVEVNRWIGWSARG